MPSKRRSSKSSVVGAVLAVGALSAAGAAHAQDYGTPNPPIDVSTAPVPQGNAPGPQGTVKGKKGAPAPPPPPVATPTPAPATTSNSSSSGGSAPPTTFNNEGSFKISGTKGTGAVGTATKGGKTPTPKSKVVAKAKIESPIAEWPGFRMTDDGGSEVMVEFSKAIGAPTEHKAAGSVTYIFPGALVTKHNNKNPLLTIHFNTPVLDARLVSAKGELHLVVQLRPGIDVAAVTGIRPATEGTKQQFFVKFPSGSYLPANDELDKNPDAKTEQGKAAFDKKNKGEKKNGGSTGGPGATKGPEGF